MIIILNQDKDTIRKLFGVYTESDCTVHGKTSTTQATYLGRYDTHKRCKEIIEEIVRHIDEYSMLEVYKMPEK